jgi:hypothetical protein
LASPNSLVDGVTDLSEPTDVRAAAPRRPAARYVRVAFAAGRTGLLDMTADRSRTWVDVLRSLQETGRPAYVEIDPQTNVITELLLPMPYTVERIKPVKDGLEVELVISHARHHLRRSNPHFNELRKALEAARRARTPVFVTETLSEHEIIHVRPAAGERGVAKE